MHLFPKYQTAATVCCPVLLCRRKARVCFLVCLKVKRVPHAIYRTLEAKLNVELKCIHQWTQAIDVHCSLL